MANYVEVDQPNKVDIAAPRPMAAAGAEFIDAARRFNSLFHVYGRLNDDKKPLDGKLIWQPVGADPVELQSTPDAMRASLVNQVGDELLLTIDECHALTNELAKAAAMARAALVS